ncbi:hypothetical protein [Edaphobacter aggregans]|uniref:hypothetical protein n=1 Tax=Edaphobacter aggregans TaxID=570835 RepID=UPI000558E984|nr:hypothetical protein [Edaphobacter aggregans]
MNDPIPGQLLGNVLRDHDCLRLAVLNACEGARQSNKDPFSGAAQSLCQQRLLRSPNGLLFEVQRRARAAVVEPKPEVKAVPQAAAVPVARPEPPRAAWLRSSAGTRRRLARSSAARS